MNCPYAASCGGCLYRNMTETAYQALKEKEFGKKLSALSEQPQEYAKPLFIEDGHRRRASLAFEKKKGKIILGFNAHRSKEIIDIEKCALLTDKLNKILPSLKNLLEEIVRQPPQKLKKNKKKSTSLNMDKGDVWLCEADNGIDIVFETEIEFDLPQREAIFEFSQKETDVIRISHRKRKDESAETIIEKTSPKVTMGGVEVYIPAGTFLQASKAAETALINQVQNYIGEDTGLIADLFCGVGTFSYPLSRRKSNRILAADSSREALKAFEYTVNKNKINNIKILEKNLFKYPLDKDELKGFDIIIFDPPRAGAKAQIKEIAAMDDAEKPKKIIGISCNPESFVQDAEILIKNGYKLQKITMIDQFIYSPHMELTSLFIRKDQ